MLRPTQKSKQNIMKKNLIIVLLALLGVTQLSAQEGEYIPFVREGVKWVCYFDSEYCHAYEVDWSRFYPLGKTYFTLEIKGDTVINGKAYKKMHKYSGDAINAQCDTVPVCLREEGKIVYGIIPNPEEYYGLFIGYGMWFYKRPDINIVDAARSGEEFILYDFSNPENYYNTIYHLRNGDGSLSNQSSEFNYEGCDEVSIGDRMARCYRFKYLGFFDVFFIEGIGYDSNIYGYTLGYLYVSRNQMMHPWCQGLFLNHVEENGKIIYKGIRYDEHHVQMTAADVNGDGVAYPSQWRHQSERRDQHQRRDDPHRPHHERVRCPSPSASQRRVKK